MRRGMNIHQLRTNIVLSSDCRKTSIVIKNGVWGVAPRRVAGTSVPVFTPFPGERGQGDRDNKSEVNFKNRLFLQTELRTNIVRSFFSVKNQIPSCIINSCDEGKLHRRQKALTAVFI